MSSTLMRPMRGWSRKSQPIAVMKPGMSRPKVSAVQRTDLAGRSVRSTSQAMRQAEGDGDEQAADGEAGGVPEGADDEGVLGEDEVVAEAIDVAGHAAA